MSMPWWGCGLIILWCIPPVYAAQALFFMKPLKMLDENGEPYQQASLLRRLFGLSVALPLLIVLWPYFYWAEIKPTSRHNSDFSGFLRAVQELVFGSQNGCW